MIEDKYRQEVLKLFPDLKEMLDSSLSISFQQQALLLKAKPGDQLFSETDPVRLFPLVISGSIKVYKMEPNGKSVVLYEVTPGEGCVLSTSSLLGKTNYPASGKVESELVAIGIPKDLFYQLVDKSAMFREYVFKIFSHRLNHLLEMIEEVSFKKLDHRLIKYLLEKAPELKSTHQKIADDLGSSREIISRLLKRFEKDNLIVLERERILIYKDKLLNLLTRPKVI
mgnify:CR=1 FL=1